VREVEKQVAFDKAFADYLVAQGISCLNVTDDLVAEARRSDNRMYYWLDIHWTADGNRLVAQSVADFLASRPDWAKHL
jgi:lysophospholipase L1-like esterase